MIEGGLLRGNSLIKYERFENAPEQRDASRQLYAEHLRERILIGTRYAVDSDLRDRLDCYWGSISTTYNKAEICIDTYVGYRCE
jgi:hypothetical protein